MSKTILYIAPPQEYFKNVIKVIRENSKKGIIYVTTNKPYEHLINLFKEQKIDFNNIFFIDCISKQITRSKEYTKNCVYLESPSDITGLSIAMTQASKLISGEKTLLLDSLSTLFIYNNEDVVGKFSNFIINMIRTNSVSCIFFVLESDMDKKIMSVISSFVDEVRK